jgi:hypothetical protein
MSVRRRGAVGHFDRAPPLGRPRPCQHCRNRASHCRSPGKIRAREDGNDVAVHPRMATHPTATETAAKGSVIVVGGNGGMSERYRAVVEERGLELRHFEKRVPNGTRRILGRVAAVVVMVGMVSHALRDQARALVPDDAPVVYLRSASVSALRNAVAALDAS